jgi:HlyD family secretion protein
MRRRWLWILIVVAALAGGGWAAAHRGPAPTEVQVAVVVREDLQAKVSANGKIQAQKKVDLSATIPGQVTHLAFKEGDPVKQGQFLLQIDPANPRATAESTEASVQGLLRDAESARANLEQARADFRRADENHRAKIVPDADFERSRTALTTAIGAAQAADQHVQQARATLVGAKDALSKTTVRAPIDGIVTAKRVEEGEVAVVGVLNQPGTVLLTISDMSVVEAEMEVDETSIPNVALSQTAVVRIDAYPNRTFAGSVTDVGNSPIVKTGTQSEAIKFKVKVQLKDPPADIKPGLSVQADIFTGFRAQALVVPIQALVVREVERRPHGAAGDPRDEEGVYLLEGGKARFQPIQTGLLGALDLEVRSGLKGGETIITGPFKALRTLKPGDPAKIEQKKDEGRPSS